jgi:hypothetical protein
MTAQLLAIAAAVASTEPRRQSLSSLRCASYWDTGPPPPVTCRRRVVSLKHDGAVVAGVYQNPILQEPAQRPRQHDSLHVLPLAHLHTRKLRACRTLGSAVSLDGATNTGLSRGHAAGNPCLERTRSATESRWLMCTTSCSTIGPAVQATGSWKQCSMTRCMAGRAQGWRVRCSSRCMWPATTI